MLDNFKSSDLFYWSLLFALLLFLSYSAFAIKAEKDIYLKTAKKFSLDELELLIPSWWLQQTCTPHFIHFQSPYSWQCHLRYEESNKNAQDILIQELALKKIIMDEDQIIKNNFPNKLGPSFSFERTEGTGTKNEEERVYIDLLVIKKNQKTWIMSSESAVLSGCVEGPYFEEMITRLKCTS